MADDWPTPIKDWTDGVALPASELDAELRDRFTAIQALFSQGYSTDRSVIWHAHEVGLLSARPTTNLHVGMTYIASDLGARFDYIGTRWEFAHAYSRIAEHFSDDFTLSTTTGNVTSINQTNQLGWASSVSGTGLISLISNPGLSEIRLVTGTTTSSSVGLASQAGGTHYLMDAAIDRVPAYYYARARLSSANDIVTLFGLADSPALSSTPTGIYFKAANGGAGGNWHCITRYLGSQTDTDSGTACDTSYHDFEVFIDSLTQVRFFIDGVLEATHSGGGVNIPTGANLELQNYMVNAVASSKQLHLDRIDWVAKR